MERKVAVGVITLSAIVLLTGVSFAGYGKKNEQKAEEPAAAPAVADDSQAAAPDAAQQEMMAKMTEYMTPNENHRVLDALIGDWTYTSKHWMSPAAPAEETTGTASSKWIMDGRFVEQSVQGTMMEKPFNGTSLIGYDNAGKEYQSVWYDNMGTGMMVTKGSYDAANKTLTTSGNFNCPLRGNMAVRWVTKIIDANSYSFEMWGPDEAGTDFKGMEIIYTKKQ